MIPYLKIDLINQLRKEGMPLMEAIHTAGIRRLRAILMTSLASIIAMIPILFTFDMGSELQKPLAVAMVYRHDHRHIGKCIYYPLGLLENLQQRG